jgi:predicted HAD superfamily Cof-like phosphohydrolase
MTELETKLVALLRASEAESKQREQRLLESVESLRQQVETSAQQVQQLADQQNELIERYNQVAELLAEELRQ